MKIPKSEYNALSDKLKAEAAATEARDRTTETTGYPLVDARCTHTRCNNPDVYRMIGSCSNCHNGPLLILITAGHQKPNSARCPKCGCDTVRAERLATDNEIPVSADPAEPIGADHQPGELGPVFDNQEHEL